VERQHDAAAPGADPRARHPDRRPRWDNADFGARVLLVAPPCSNVTVRGGVSLEAPLNPLDMERLAEGLAASEQAHLDLWD
jgi:hypothetical protein